MCVDGRGDVLIDGIGGIEEGNFEYGVFLKDVVSMNMFSM